MYRFWYLLIFIGLLFVIPAQDHSVLSSQEYSHYLFADEDEEESLLPIRHYQNEPTKDPEQTILYRAEADPLNIIATIIFACAIIHVLFARKIHILSQQLEKKGYPRILYDMVGFLGEIEIIFGIWAIPLLATITWLYNWPTAIDYLNSRNYTEAMAVVIIIALASTYPIIHFAEKVMRKLASLGGGTPAAWWFVLLTVGPLLGSFITEGGAMILTAILLARQFFIKQVSIKLSYATLGLLFTNISLGGICTTFASPPALMVSQKWNWDTTFMLEVFAWKSLLIILIANVTYFLYFRKEFALLEKQTDRVLDKGQIIEAEEKAPEKVPLWVTFGNILFLYLVIAHLHDPVIFTGFFLLFLGFHQATQDFQLPLKLKPALMVGFFIAGLVIHAGLQEWWISPLLDHASPNAMMLISLVVGPFTDNAALAYLATFIPNLSEAAKYSVMVGAISAGGLTVIGNAPNPAGLQILYPYFTGGISAKNLFLAALTPALIAIIIFYIFRV